MTIDLKEESSDTGGSGNGERSTNNAGSTSEDWVGWGCWGGGVSWDNNGAGGHRWGDWDIGGGNWRRSWGDENARGDDSWDAGGDEDGGVRGSLSWDLWDNWGGLLAGWVRGWHWCSGGRTVAVGWVGWDHWVRGWDNWVRSWDNWVGGDTGDGASGWAVGNFGFVSFFYLILERAYIYQWQRS